MRGRGRTGRGRTGRGRTGVSIRTDLAKWTRSGTTVRGVELSIISAMIHHKSYGGGVITLVH